MTYRGGILFVISLFFVSFSWLGLPSVSFGADESAPVILEDAQTDVIGEPERDDALIAEGKQLFEESAGGFGCASCHGSSAIGNPDIGAPYIRGVSRAQLDAALNGAVPDMDFFDLGKPEKAAIFAYLEFLTHEHEASLEPDVAVGKLIFEETAGGIGCAACHGLDARGGYGPDIRDTDARSILRQLRENEEMEFIDLGKTEIDQVAAYLTYLAGLEPGE